MNRFRKQLLFLCDTVILALVIALFYFFMGSLSANMVIISGQLWSNLLLLYGCTVAFQLALRTYDSLWRYAESREYLMLLTAAALGFFCYEVLCRILLSAWLPFIFLTGVASLWVLGMLYVRFLYRTYRSRVRYRRDGHFEPVAIVGAGAAGVQLLDELQSNPENRYRVQCFFDDDTGKIGKNIHGVQVKGTIDEAPERLRAMDIREVIVAIPSVEEHRRKEILFLFSAKNSFRVHILPGALELIDRKPIRQQLRAVQIEDLLGRDAVRLDEEKADAFLRGKIVMVTGGGGSIGSELCRQIAKHCPRRLVIVDIYENNAYDIEQELRCHHGDALNLVVEIASIRDEERVRQLFARHRPEVVVHAAAHKHVPLMETNPQEAVRNNVFGTWNLVRAAEEFGTAKFIQISTDKAVNPTSVMGATKRLCEMILQAQKGRSRTCFAAVRFGNVLGSNGSVVPLFKRQIAAGGPVTVTDKRITRFFMTIPEAAQLVLLSGAMARQNELYVLDMGKPVKILDLAENLICLSGLTPYRDIDIVETGLRPGEKLYEELLIASRDIEKTENDQIYIERQPAITPEELAAKLTVLRTALEQNEPAAVRAALHAVVPAYREPEEVNERPGVQMELPPAVPEAVEESVHSA